MRQHFSTNPRLSRHAIFIGIRLWTETSQTWPGWETAHSLYQYKILNMFKLDKKRQLKSNIAKKGKEAKGEIDTRTTKDRPKYYLLYSSPSVSVLYIKLYYIRI